MEIHLGSGDQVVCTGTGLEEGRGNGILSRTIEAGRCGSEGLGVPLGFGWGRCNGRRRMRGAVTAEDGVGSSFLEWMMGVEHR